MWGNLRLLTTLQSGRLRISSEFLTCTNATERNEFTVAVSRGLLLHFLNAINIPERN
ncbi:hypothetical protein J6590_088168, partial [Homalodisca vitripennis]